MGIITKAEHAGIDGPILKLQTYLYNQLLLKWTSITADQYASYGRCYRNKTTDGYVAQVFDGGIDYKDVYWNDSLAAISFFGITDKIQHGKIDEANIHLIFFVDLKKIKTSLGSRADEEVRTDVSGLIKPTKYSFTMISTDLWLENVLREYPGSRRDKGLAAVDMHPVHCFRFNLKLLYNENKNC